MICGQRLGQGRAGYKKHLFGRQTILHGDVSALTACLVLPALSIRLSVLPISPSVCITICLHVCLSILPLSIWQPVFLSVSLSPSVRISPPSLFIHQSFNLFLCSASLSIYICPSSTVCVCVCVSSTPTPLTPVWIPYRQANQFIHVLTSYRPRGFLLDLNTSGRGHVKVTGLGVMPVRLRS